MNFNKNDIYHGFKFIKEEDIKELNSKALLFEHVKSGAKLMHLKNDDDNKVFSISFRTPPKNSKGIPHILEHSVLCGSEKYPVKEPFMELVKGSLNTFLNAFTFSDKTMYPVASRNDKDFANLMDVYIDAVLHPNIYKYKEIFEQEGWHHELNNKNEDITYKGVVYNEMKGAFSSPDGILMRKIQNSLFPDTTYGFESGGDPYDIPKLTYEEFINFHKKYYHPANSYIYLYGDMDTDEKLEYLDREYLSKYDKIEVDSKIEEQKPFEKEREIVEEYPIMENEEEKNKSYLSLNFVISKATDPETYLAFEILEYLLLETPAAPLKKALIDANLGSDAYGIFDNSIMQPYFSVIVKNSNEEQKEKFKKVVFDTLEKLVSKGINKKLIEAAINTKEFQLREADYSGMPKGLVYSVKAMDSWLYDESPVMHLKYEEILNKIKTALKENYFEKFIEKYLLNNNHRSVVIIKPSKVIGKKKAEDIKNELSKFKSSLSEEKLNSLVEDTRKLKERQSEAEKPEDLKKLPLLSLSDIDKKSEKLPIEEKEIDGVKTLHHEMFTNKIAYVNMYFDTPKDQYEDIKYLALLAGVLGRVNTEKYNYDDLSNEMDINTGSIDFTTSVYTEQNSNENYHPKFIVRVKVLKPKIEKMFELLNEIMFKSRFDDKKRLSEIIKEMKSRLEMYINEAGHVVAGMRLNSYFSASGKYTECTKGIEFYQFLCSLDQNFDEKFGEIKNKLEEVSKLIFNKNNMVMSVTGDKDIYDEFENKFSSFEIKDGEKISEKNSPYIERAYNEGLLAPSKIQFVAKGYSFKKLGFNYSGKMMVLKNIMSYTYLWNNLRVLGGAYGCFAIFTRSGNAIMISYRDPNLKETLDVYDNAYKYAQNFKADEREMTKYIIGAISEVDFPLTPKMKGDKADNYYFSKITYDDIQKEREEILSTTEEDIRNFSELLKSVMRRNYMCVFGSALKIKENKDIFNNLAEVFK